MRSGSLVLVSNRLPIDETTAPDAAGEWCHSPAGLVRALHPVLREAAAVWAGWAGGVGPAPAVPDLDGVRMHAIRLWPSRCSLESAP